MNIKFYFTLVLYFFLLNLLFSQESNTYKSNYKALYRLTYQKDSTDIETKNFEDFSLLFNNVNSLFQSENNRYNDSLIIAFGKNSNIADVENTISSAMRTKKNSRFKFNILKTPENLVILDKIFTDQFVYFEKADIKWELFNEKKEINGFTCQKAICFFAGRMYIAWYTIEVPTPEGPYKFKGLPGLIVSIQDNKKHYAFEMTELKKHIELFSIDTQGIAVVEKAAFFKARENFKKSFVSQLESRGLSISGDENLKKRIKKNRNNNIEISY